MSNADKPAPSPSRPLQAQPAVPERASPATPNILQVVPEEPRRRTFRPPIVDEEALQSGAWMGVLLFLVVLAGGVGLLGYVLMAPFAEFF